MSSANILQTVPFLQRNKYKLIHILLLIYILIFFKRIDERTESG